MGRIYYGTDTRAVGFAAGAALACVLGRRDRTWERVVGRWGTVGGIVAGGALAGAVVALDGSERWLYGPGFAAIAVASVVLVMVGIGAGPVATVLSARPLVAVGRVSYGVYLWHWPVIVVLDAERTGLSGPLLGLLWVGVTGLLTTLSWVLVEQRVPRPVLSSPWRSVSYGAVAVAVAFGAAAVVEHEERNRPALALPAPVVSATGDVSTEPDTVTVTTFLAADTDLVDAPSGPPSAPDDLGRPDGPGATDPPLALPLDRPLRVLVVGDSVAASLASDADEETFALAGFGDVVVANRALVACPVVRDGRWVGDGPWEVDDPPACTGDDRFVAEVEAFEADVTYVFFGWSGVGGGRILEDGRTLSPCDAEFDRRFGAEMAMLVDRLSSGSNVVVSNVAPPASHDQEMIAPATCLNRALDALTVPVYDYAGWICPEGRCTLYDPLRPDAVHFGVDEDTRRAIVEHLVAGVLTSAGYRPGAG